MTRTIETRRCVLTPVRAEDTEEALPLFTDPEVRRFLGYTLTEAGARARIAAWAQAPDRGPFWSRYLSVRSRETGGYLGLVTVCPHHNPFVKEVSYQFLPSCWGRGYAAEAVGAVVETCLGPWGRGRVVSETQARNLRSVRLLETLGGRLTRELVRFGEAQKVFTFRR